MYRNAPSSSEINIRPSALNITALQVSLQTGQNKHVKDSMDSSVSKSQLVTSHRICYNAT